MIIISSLATYVNDSLEPVALAERSHHDGGLHRMSITRLSECSISDAGVWKEKRCKLDADGVRIKEDGSRGEDVSSGGANVQRDEALVDFTRRVEVEDLTAGWTSLGGLKLFDCTCRMETPWLRSRRR
jgi:hypothetical protein